MALAIDVEFLTGTYEAGLGGERAEWPPHPARLFCALVAQAESEEERAVLRWLEEQPPPDVIAPEESTTVLSGYVPTNSLPRSRLDLKRVGATYLARLTGTRTWPRALPARPRARVVWPDAEPPDGAVDRLRTLASRVAYLGRPTGMVLATVTTAVPPIEEGFRRYVPSDDGEELLRVPYPGYLDALTAAFDADGPAYEVARAHPYTQPTSSHAVEAAPLRGPYIRLLTLGFPPGSGIAGWHAARVAVAFRDAVLARLGRPEYRQADDPWDLFDAAELASIHGHSNGMPPEQRCAFLALPFVGSQHATGEVIGVAIAVGRAVEPRLRKALLQLVGLDRDEVPRLTSLRIPGPDVSFPLLARDGRWTLEPERWCRPSTRWASVFPVILDRWPKRGTDFGQVVRDGITRAGYPEPVDVEIRRSAAVAGAPILRPGDRRRRPDEPNRPWAHVVVTFPSRVEGPVVLGHLRFIGLGLCVPQDDHGRQG